MIASGREAAIEDLIRELEIADPTETGLGTWDRPDGEMRVSMFHETGHVYAVPDDVTEERDAELLFRLPVEKIGIDAAIKAVEGYLGATRQPKLRECDNAELPQPCARGQRQERGARHLPGGVR